MPITDQQLAVNRANAAKSTGPRTPEGKARSSQNARTHGFTASTFVVVRLEDLDEIAHLHTDLIAIYQPVNSQEMFALDSMAIAQQEMRRASRLGSGIFNPLLPHEPRPGRRWRLVARYRNHPRPKSQLRLGRWLPPHGEAKQLLCPVLTLQSPGRAPLPRRGGRIQPSQSPAIRITKGSPFRGPTRRKRTRSHPRQRTRFKPGFR